MKKLYKYASFIELALTVLSILLMYAPVFKFKGDGSNKNAFISILGMKHGSYSWIEFSFFAMLPYILLFVLLVLVIIFDSKKNIVVNSIKVGLYIVCAVMFFGYINLLNPANTFTLTDIKKLANPQWGHIVTGIICLIAAVFSALELFFDSKSKKAVAKAV